jgi:hypothetical protein
MSLCAYVRARECFCLFLYMSICILLDVHVHVLCCAVFVCLNFAAQVLRSVGVSVNISPILVAIPHQIAQQRYQYF